MLKKEAEIRASLNELAYYRNGTMESAVQLTVKAFQGDKNAEKLLEETAAWREEHKDSLLERIAENWTHGLMRLTLSLKL